MQIFYVFSFFLSKSPQIQSAACYNRELEVFLLRLFQVFCFVFVAVVNFCFPFCKLK